MSLPIYIDGLDLLWFNSKHKGVRLDQLTHWLIGLSGPEKQLQYENERITWRRLNNIPDQLNVKGANVIPAKILNENNSTRLK